MFPISSEPSDNFHDIYNDRFEMPAERKIRHENLTRTQKIQKGMQKKIGITMRLWMTYQSMRMMS